MKELYKKVKRILALLCALSLCGGVNVQAAPESRNSFPFYEDGDVVGIIGDSITHVQYGPVSYVEALYHYYLCQFPERTVEFRNLGTAGYKCSDILNIYDRDPAFHGINKVIIMLGMNEAILELSTEEYMNGMEEIINKLKADGLSGEDILVLAPTPYDDMCALNYDRQGNPYRLIDHLLTDFTEQLAQKTQEWGVQYLDLHTVFLDMTKELQQENPKNTLTRGDCIHPSTTGQMLMAYYILQKQGAEELDSEVFVPSEGEARYARGEITNFYRGEKGISWDMKPGTLPAALTEEFQEYLDFFPQGMNLYREPLKAAGLAGDKPYHVYMGETELGNFTGKELEEGVNLALLDTHPLQETAQKLDHINRKLHEKLMDHRTMWIQVMMGQANYSEEEIQEAYDNWRAEDTELRNEMYVLAQEAIENPVRITIVEEGYSIQELDQERLEAIRESGEQIIKGIREKIQRAEEVQKEQEDKGTGGILLLAAAIGVFLVAVLLGLSVLLNKKRRKKSSRRRRKKRKRKH